MKATDPPIIVSHTYNFPLLRVWRAITNPTEMKQWFFSEMESFEPEVGFETSFLVDTGERQFIHLWNVTEVAVGKRIIYRWRYQDYMGDAFVIFDLNGDENSCELTVTCDVTEDFQDDIPEFKRESCIGGWEYFLGQRLSDFLK